MAQYNPSVQFITFQPRLKLSKARINQFNQPPSTGFINSLPHQQIRPSTSNTLQPKRIYSILRPTLLPKKVTSQNQFPKSLSKKKSSLLDSLKKASLVQYQDYLQKKIIGSNHLNRTLTPRIQDSIQNAQIYQHENKYNHHPHPKGPHININLQMLLKRRRTASSQIQKKYQQMLYSSRRK